MLKVFLWLRYLRRKKIVFLSVAAVGLSVALLVVVQSLFTGIIQGVRESYTAEVGDLFLLPGSPIPQYTHFLDELERIDGIEAAGPFLLGSGLLHLETGDVREVIVQGIEPSQDVKFNDWNESLLTRKDSSKAVDFTVPGYPDEYGCWIGIVIVAEPNEKTDKYDLAELKKLIGGHVVLTTSDVNKKRRVLKLRISDVAFTDTYFGDKTLYLPYELWHQLQFGRDQDDHARYIKIKLAPKSDSGFVSANIRGRWQQFARDKLGYSGNKISHMGISTVQELNRDYLDELRKQMGMLMLIFGIICSVGIMLIFCILYMIVETKRRDIAIIKSCGTSNFTVALIFTGFGGCVGIIGAVLGIILGVIVTGNINTFEQWVRVFFGLKLWQSSVYVLNKIPDTVNWSGAWPIVLAAIAGSILGAIIPAIVAARTKPVEILRYE